MGRSGRLRLFALIAAVLCSGLLSAAAPTEYEVKAVFLFNFSQFVDWPASAFADAQAPLVIGVLGEDPFDGALEEVVRGEVVNGRPLAVTRYADLDDIDHVGACHILFIDRSMRERLPQILDRLRGRSVLTVGDSAEFARTGGMIQFVLVDNRIRLQVNLQAARVADLTISSKLLRPAQIVSPRR